MIECRDTSLPFVFFGIDCEPDIVPADKMDPEWPYCWIETSRDAGIPNKFAGVAFDEARSEFFRKKNHHPFQGNKCFYTVTTVEWQNKRPKLHVPDRLKATLSNFGAFVEESRAQWSVLTRVPAEFERMIGGTPSIQLTFMLVVHNSPQFQYVDDVEGLVESEQTPLFARYHSERGVEFYILEFVRIGALAQAVARNRQTYKLLLNHVLPTVLAARGA